MKFFISHIYIILTILFAVASQLIIKWKMSSFSLDEYDNIYEKFIFAISMLFNPYIVISLLFTLLSGLSWMIAMTRFELSYAYPFTTIGFVLIFIFSILLFNEPLTWHKSIGLVLIVLGVIISSRSI